MISTIATLIGIGTPALGGITWLIILAHKHGISMADQTNALQKLHEDVQALVSRQADQEHRLDSIEAFLTSKFRGYLPFNYRNR